MLGLYGCALLKELNIRRIYCSGNKTIRSDLIKGFGAIPISDGMNIKILNCLTRFHLIEIIRNRGAKQSTKQI